MVYSSHFFRQGCSGKDIRGLQAVPVININEADRVISVNQVGRRDRQDPASVTVPLW